MARTAYHADDLVLCRSDAGDGGWSLHAPGSTDEQIAEGAAPYLASGEAEWIEESGAWSRPTDGDYAEALRVLAARDEQPLKALRDPSEASA